jgi:hypothetical protein
MSNKRPLEANEEDSQSCQKNLEDIFENIDKQLEYLKSPELYSELSINVYNETNPNIEIPPPMVDSNLPFPIIVTTHGEIHCKTGEELRQYEYNYVPDTFTIPEDMTIFKFTLSAEGVISFLPSIDVKYIISVVNKHVNKLLNPDVEEEDFDEIINEIKQTTDELRSQIYKENVINYIRRKCREYLSKKLKKSKIINKLCKKFDTSNEKVDRDFLIYQKHGYKLFKLTGGEKMVNKIFLRKINEKEINDYSIIELPEKKSSIDRHYYKSNPPMRIGSLHFGNSPQTKKQRYRYEINESRNCFNITYDELEELPDLLTRLDPKPPLPRDLSDEEIDLLPDDDAIEYANEWEEYVKYDEKYQAISLKDMVKYYQKHGLKILIIFDLTCSVFKYKTDDGYYDILNEEYHESVRDYIRNVDGKGNQLPYGGNSKSKKTKSRKLKSKNPKSIKNKSIKNKSRKNE